MYNIFLTWDEGANPAGLETCGPAVCRFSTGFVRFTKQIYSLLRGVCTESGHARTRDRPHRGGGTVVVLRSPAHQNYQFSIVVVVARARVTERGIALSIKKE